MCDQVKGRGEVARIDVDDVRVERVIVDPNAQGRHVQPQLMGPSGSRCQSVATRAQRLDAGLGIRLARLNACLQDAALLDYPVQNHQWRNQIRTDR